MGNLPERCGTVSGVILAGGASSRLHEHLGGLPDKGLLPLGAATVLEAGLGKLTCVFDDVVLVSDKALPGLDGVRQVGDLIRRRARNALAGMHAGLSAAPGTQALIVAGDMPFISEKLIRFLLTQTDGTDVVIPRVDGFLQPLLAVYDRACLPHMTAQLRRDNYRIFDFFGQVRVRTVEEPVIRRYDPNLLSFFNINTWADYQQALALWAEGVR